MHADRITAGTLGYRRKTVNSQKPFITMSKKLKPFHKRTQ